MLPTPTPTPTPTLPSSMISVSDWGGVSNGLMTVIVGSFSLVGDDDAIAIFAGVFVAAAAAAEAGVDDKDRGEPVVRFSCVGDDVDEISILENGDVCSGVCIVVGDWEGIRSHHRPPPSRGVGPNSCEFIGKHSRNNTAVRSTLHRCCRAHR